MNHDFRLFYAGACEGQMPVILTMIQVQRLTPTPAVLCIVSKLNSTNINLICSQMYT